MGVGRHGNWGSFSQAAAGTTTLSQTRTSNMANQLTSIAGTGAFSLKYDQAGNTTLLPLTPSGGTLVLSGTCTYDAWNRLVSASAGTACTFYYDGLGRRTQKLTPSATTDYYLADQQVVETWLTSSGSSAASLQYQYAWSPRYIDAPVLRDDFTASPTYPRLYYLDDANFNVTSLVATAGTVAERCVYDAYGVPTFYSSSWTSPSTSSSVGNTVLYTGRELDLETGLYYYRARYYQGTLGVFVSRDPAEPEASLYRYASNRPANQVDPLGLQGEEFRFRQWEAAHLTEKLGYNPLENPRPAPTPSANAAAPAATCQLESGPSYSGPVYKNEATHQPAIPPEDRRDFHEAYFEMTAKFKNDPQQHACSKCCEVRQDIQWNIKGFSPHPGFKVDEALNKWVEDRDPSTPPNKYGYRNNTWDPGNTFSGNEYKGWDDFIYPKGFEDASSGKLALVLKFRLRVVDVCNQGEDVEAGRNCSCY